MGVIKRGILGGVSGKIANVVGGSWKGIDYLRALPLSVANPKTALQMAQRNAMTNIIKVVKDIKGIILKPLNDRFAVKMSGVNLFVKRSIKAWDGATFSNPDDLIISEGSLTGLIGVSAVASAAGSNVVVDWSNNSGTGTAAADDEIFVLVLNNNGEFVGAVGAAAERLDESVNLGGLGLPAIGQPIHIYSAFRSANGFSVSNQTYTTINVGA